MLARWLAIVSLLALAPAGVLGAPAAETVTVRGSVLLPDGRPAAGARVFLDLYGVHGRETSEVRADAAGNFSLDTTLSRKDAPVQALALQPGFAAAWTQVVPGEDLTLHLGAHPVAFAGILTGPEGQPVAGAEVALLSLAGRDARGTDGIISLGGTGAWRATTGPDGRFSFPDLPAGATAGYVVRAAGMAQAMGAWALGQGDLTVMLVRAATVTGRVLAAGQPVPRVVVTATVTVPPVYRPEQASTAADGTYTIGGLGTGTVVLRVANPPAGLCSPFRVGNLVTAGQTLTGQDLLLTPGALLSGKVTAAATGAVLPAVQLSVAWAPPGAAETNMLRGRLYPDLPGAVTAFSATTGPDGTYQLRVAPGSVLVRITGHPAGSTGEWSANPPQRRLNLAEGGSYPGLNFALTAPPRIHGRVLRPDGTPAAGVEVIVASGYYNPSAPPLLTDAQGNFTADLPNSPGNAPAPPPSFLILARDAAAGQIGLTFVGGPQDQAYIRLDTGGYLAVTAVDGQGRPQAAVGILVYLTSEDGRMTAMLPGGVTDAQGRLRLGPLPLDVELKVFPNWQQRAYLLDTAWDDLGPITLQAGKDRELPALHLDLRGRDVSGTVLDSDGHPAAGALVSCSVGPREVTHADDHGAFTLTNVPLQGNVQFAARHATEPRFALVSVAPDEQEGIVLHLQALGALTGTVVGADGQPVTGAQVMVIPSPELRVQGNNTQIWSGLAPGYTGSPLVTDAAGQWHAAGLFPGGPYTVTAHALGQGLQATTEVTVQPGTTTDLGKLTIKPAAAPGSVVAPPPALPGAAGPAPPD